MGERVAILQANLGDFDVPIDPVEQTVPFTFHRWTDDNFPPITGLTPRLQYRIPKYFGWDMLPGYDIYIWLDGTVSFQRDDCLKWYLSQLGDGDMAFFAHPNRTTIKQEVDHIDGYLNKKIGKRSGQEYMRSRYMNGLHKEQLGYIQRDENFKDDKLYASTSFIYRNTGKVRSVLSDWWYWQSRYFTCDQVVLPYVTKDLDVKVLNEPIYKSGYLSLVSHHQ